MLQKYALVISCWIAYILTAPLYFFVENNIQAAPIPILMFLLTIQFYCLAKNSMNIYEIAIKYNHQSKNK